MSNGRLRVSRRDFIKFAATSAAAMGAAWAFGSAPHLARGAGETLKLWWWGEQEAPGVSAWIEETVALFKEQTGATIEPTLQDTTMAFTEFTTASAANSAPDLQFVWNGIYHMETAWMGYIEPLEGLLDKETLRSASPTVLNQYDGHTYSASWYSCGPLCVYNREAFGKAGLNADEPPLTFDALMDACEKVKAAGYIPLSAGMKDVLWHDWYTAHGLSPNLDTPADALKLFAGEGLDWREPRYYDHWAKLQQLWQADYLNDDIMSIDLYPGIDLFSTGKSAMTWTVVPLLQSMRDAVGADNVGVFVWPASGQGKLDGMPIADTNGFCISSQSRYKDIAAEFIKLTQTQERMTALWNTCNALPTTVAWDGDAVIADPWWQEVWARWVHGKTTVYVNEMMPSLVLSDAVNVNTEKAILGTFTPEQCGENAHNVVQRWREQNPDMLEKYSVWATSMAKVWTEEYA